MGILRSENEIAILKISRSIKLLNAMMSKETVLRLIHARSCAVPTWSQTVKSIRIARGHGGSFSAQKLF
jgi:hypothetical protein